MQYIFVGIMITSSITVQLTDSISWATAKDIAHVWHLSALAGLFLLTLGHLFYHFNKINPVRRLTESGATSKGSTAIDFKITKGKFHKSSLQLFRKSSNDDTKTEGTSAHQNSATKYKSSFESTHANPAADEIHHKCIIEKSHKKCSTPKNCLDSESPKEMTKPPTRKIFPPRVTNNFMPRRQSYVASFAVIRKRSTWRNREIQVAKETRKTFIMFSIGVTSISTIVATVVPFMILSIIRTFREKGSYSERVNILARNYNFWNDVLRYTEIFLTSFAVYYGHRL